MYGAEFTHKVVDQITQCFWRTLARVVTIRMNPSPQESLVSTVVPIPSDWVIPTVLPLNRKRGP